MKKTAMTIAAVAFVAMTGLFAQPNARAKTKGAEGKPLPERKDPPKIELPAESDVKAYHEAQIQSLKLLLDAQVKAKIITPEWAEAKMSILKAVQADCKGFCIIAKRTDVPFGEPGFEGPRKGRHDCRNDDRDPNRRGRRGPAFNGNFAPEEQDGNEASAIINER